MSEGSGTAPSTGEQSSGLVPQLTIGARRAASKRSSRSKTAPASVGNVTQCESARVQSRGRRPPPAHRGFRESATEPSLKEAPQAYLPLHPAPFPLRPLYPLAPPLQLVPPLL